MHLHFERNSNCKCDCAVLSLTWMGKVPEELPEDEGWKLNRTHYYQEGWLATGNVRGIVGVTFTTSHCKRGADSPLRTNYNLRGHRSEVILVKWNEPYQKLASCDSSGIIFVWIKYEGRWSIELINDRSTPVTHFSWSHDGRMALICYQDGFVLVGSVAGQRYWSSMLNIESVITCGIWTPDDQQVYISTTGGQVIVMDVHGAMVSQVQLSPDVAVSAMAWSCEKFKMEEGDDADLAPPGGGTAADDRGAVLAVGFVNGYVYLMKSFDDVSPVQVHTGLGGCMRLEWSNSRELLAVAGSVQQHPEYTNLLKFYSDTGVLLYCALIPYSQSPVTALTWGHNDKRLFVATGCQVHIAWVSRRIASLQLLCRLQIHRALPGEQQVSALPLPPRLKALIANLFAQTVRCCVPDAAALREFVSRPPGGSVRLHCTMIRHDEDAAASSGSCYTLYLEYLGGLLPLLKGKRTSKIRPEFVIFDPQVDELMATADSTDSAKSSGSSQNAASDTSDTEREDGCGSPRIQRRRRRRHRSQPGDKTATAAASAAAADKAGPAEAEQQDDLAYVDTLPEHIRLVEVTSNIWGTKFKIHGLATSVPANLGQVTYKTSLLHLQPRQMSLVMTELRDDVPPDPDPAFNPNLFSEDEEDSAGGGGGGGGVSAPPIAPMTPAGCCRPAPALARAESYEDEPPPAGLRAVSPLEAPGDVLVGRAAPSHCPGEAHRVKAVLAEQAAAVRLGLSLNLEERRSAAVQPSVHRRKDKHCGSQVGAAPRRDDMKYIDDDARTEPPTPDRAAGSRRAPAVGVAPRSPACLADSMVRSCSVGYLDLVDAQLVPCEVALALLRKEAPKRLVLVTRRRPRRRGKEPRGACARQPRLRQCGKSRSLDSSDLLPAAAAPVPPPPCSSSSSRAPAPAACDSSETDEGPAAPRGLAALDCLAGRRRDLEDSRSLPSPSPCPSPRLPRSSPASPAPSKKTAKRNQSSSPIRKHLLNSPLLSRRQRKNKTMESSDDEVVHSSDEVFNGKNYRDLESFQKAQLRQKLKRGKCRPDAPEGCPAPPAGPRRREFVMHNKAPMWNENSQVYQLDFGGRVTQESAKNFQIEFRGKQVMQFGRIDGNAYTLDFQYPFSALQAFAVALANVTQRLK
ncbi:tubby-related protein 4 [Bacillus rossius redtenbacheri]|uniref:tubby-related protein 4 n=1 Tax=Bacillus rossius redtenbacheri TaxID=93214 RepID=UPI002FDD6037